MSTQAEQQAAVVTSPTPGDVTDRNWIMVLATSTTAAYIDLSAYASYFDRFIAVRADGGKVYVAASPTTTAIDKTSTGTTPTTADGANKCWPVSDGETVRFQVNKANPYLHFQADASTPKLFVRPSSNEGAYAASRGL